MDKSDKEKRQNISIHAPHEGERHREDIDKIYRYIFQSTLPTRGSDAEFLACIQDTV